MTTTYKHTVYKTENNKSIIEFNTEAKPDKQAYAFDGPEPTLEGKYAYDNVMKKWNANTIKAEVSGDKLRQLVWELYCDKKLSLDSSLTFDEACKQGIDILSLMDRIEIERYCNADCPDSEFGNCCHPSNCQKKVEAKLKPVKEKQVDNGDEWGIKTYPKKPVVEKGKSGNEKRLEAMRLFPFDDYQRFDYLDIITIMIEYSAAKDQRIAELENELLDALDLKEGNGPTALSNLKAALDKQLQINSELKDGAYRLLDKNKALEAEVKLLKSKITK